MMELTVDWIVDGGLASMMRVRLSRKMPQSKTKMMSEGIRKEGR